MIDQFTNVYSSFPPMVNTAKRRLISHLECIREKDSGERGHIWL